LLPIDNTGRKIADADLPDGYLATVDPLPRFETLKELKERRHRKFAILLPLDISARATHALLTGKEHIAKVLLHSGIVDICVLQKPLANTLSLALGNYILTSASPYEPHKPLRTCTAHQLTSLSDVQNINVFDPLSRLDAICRTNRASQSHSLSLNVIPDIIISELRDELAGYDFEANTGTVTFRINGIDCSFTVRQGVRKPGLFSLVTLQLVHKVIMQEAIADAKIWDLGCGTGFIGCTIAKLLGNAIENVLCSDIKEEARECADFNRNNHERVQVRRGDLFSVNDGAKQFHVIAFNAPFQPKAILENGNVDISGENGTDVALKFCKEVRSHLRPGGWAILAVADFVDQESGSILRDALNTSFGIKNVIVEDRLILYPCETVNGTSLAYEVQYRAQLELHTGYQFEKCSLGAKDFIAFHMRHYCARNTVGIDQPI